MAPSGRREQQALLGNDGHGVDGWLGACVLGHDEGDADGDDLGAVRYKRKRKSRESPGKYYRQKGDLPACPHWKHHHERE